jgi:hypothetical protein
MVNDRPVDLFAAKLRPGGEFRLATDDPTYLTWALMIMQRHVHAFEWLARDTRFPRTVRRLDRDPLRRQVAARGPPALLPALSPRLRRLKASKTIPFASRAPDATCRFNPVGSMFQFIVAAAMAASQPANRKPIPAAPSR